MARLHHKTAVITGGSTGIGFETARQFLHEGAQVIITGQNEERLQAAATELGDGVIPVQADVRSLQDLEHLAAEVESRWGALDIVFANAGIGSFAPLDSIDETFFDNQFDTNVKGVFFTVQKLSKFLKPGSSIILNASAVNQKGMAMGSIYFATKAAVRSLVRTLAAELGGRGIRVNSISPGLVMTHFQGKMGIPQDALEGFVQQVTSTAPLNRLGEIPEIAAAVTFLASDDSSYMTAADLVVDGGFMNV